MSDREFLVPTSDEVVDAIGVVPEVSADDEFVRVVPFELENGHDQVSLSYHVVAGSVEFRWHRDGEKIVDVSREGATSLTFGSGQGRVWIYAVFDSSSDRSELHIQIHPDVRISDTLLLH